MEALGEDSKKWRADAEKLSAFATEQTSIDGIIANPMFASMKSKVESKQFSVRQVHRDWFFPALR